MEDDDDNPFVGRGNVPWGPDLHDDRVPSGETYVDKATGLVYDVLEAQPSAPQGDFRQKGSAAQRRFEVLSRGGAVAGVAKGERELPEAEEEEAAHEARDVTSAAREWLRARAAGEALTAQRRDAKAWEDEDGYAGTREVPAFASKGGLPRLLPPPSAQHRGRVAARATTRALEGPTPVPRPTLGMHDVHTTRRVDATSNDLSRGGAVSGDAAAVRSGTHVHAALAARGDDDLSTAVGRVVLSLTFAQGAAPPEELSRLPREELATLVRAVGEAFVEVSTLAAPRPHVQLREERPEQHASRASAATFGRSVLAAVGEGGWARPAFEAGRAQREGVNEGGDVERQTGAQRSAARGGGAGGEAGWGRPAFEAGRAQREDVNEGGDMERQTGAQRSAARGGGAGGETGWGRPAFEAGRAQREVLSETVGRALLALRSAARAEAAEARGGAARDGKARPELSYGSALERVVRDLLAAAAAPPPGASDRLTTDRSRIATATARALSLVLREALREGGVREPGRAVRGSAAADARGAAGLRAAALPLHATAGGVASDGAARGRTALAARGAAEAHGAGTTARSGHGDRAAGMGETHARRPTPGASMLGGEGWGNGVRDRVMRGR